MNPFSAILAYRRNRALVIQRLRDELAALDWLKTQRCSVSFAGGYKASYIWVTVHEKAEGATITAQGKSNDSFLDAVNQAKRQVEAR